jgi:hypothetical protein
MASWKRLTAQDGSHLYVDVNNVSHTRHGNSCNLLCEVQQERQDLAVRGTPEQSLAIRVKNGA